MSKNKKIILESLEKIKDIKKLNERENLPYTIPSGSLDVWRSGNKPTKKADRDKLKKIAKDVGDDFLGDFEKKSPGRTRDAFDKPQDGVIDINDFELAGKIDPETGDVLLPTSRINFYYNQLRATMLILLALDNDQAARKQLNKYSHPKNLGFFQKLPIFSNLLKTANMTQVLGQEEISEDAGHELDTQTGDDWPTLFLRRMFRGYDAKPQEPNPDDNVRQSISNPQMLSQQGAVGKPLAQQFQYFNRFVDGANIQTSLANLAQFSKNVMEGNIQFDEDVDKLFADAMVMDYFTVLAKDLDAGAGAYFFELFLAYLAGGVVAGKESGAAGGMGEVDFFFKNGSAGSAKYLQRGGVVEQAVKSFVIGKTVTYVVAYKSGEMQTRARVVTSDPDLIQRIEVFVFNIKRLLPDEVSNFDPKFAYFKMTNMGGDELAIVKEPLDGNMELQKYMKTKAASSLVGEIILVTNSGESFRERIMQQLSIEDGEDAIDLGDQENKKKAVKLFIDTIDKSTDFQADLKKYVTEKDPVKRIRTGNAAQNSLDDAGENFKELESILASLGFRGTDPAQPMAENKKPPEITSTQLIKIINEELDNVLEEQFDACDRPYTIADIMSAVAVMGVMDDEIERRKEIRRLETDPALQRFVKRGVKLAPKFAKLGFEVFGGAVAGAVGTVALAKEAGSLMGKLFGMANKVETKAPSPVHDLLSTLCVDLETLDVIEDKFQKAYIQESDIVELLQQYMTENSPDTKLPDITDHLVDWLNTKSSYANSEFTKIQNLKEEEVNELFGFGKKKQKSAATPEEIIDGIKVKDALGSKDKRGVIFHLHYLPSDREFKFKVSKFWRGFPQLQRGAKQILKGWEGLSRYSEAMVSVIVASEIVQELVKTGDVAENEKINYQEELFDLIIQLPGSHPLKSVIDDASYESFVFDATLGKDSTL